MTKLPSTARRSSARRPPWARGECLAAALEPFELELALAEAPAFAIALAPAPIAAQLTATAPSFQCLLIDISRDVLSVWRYRAIIDPRRKLPVRRMSGACKFRRCGGRG